MEKEKPMNVRNGILYLLLLVSGTAFATGNKVDVDTSAGAQSNSSTTIMGSTPSPAIGLPANQGSSPTPLLGQVPPPPYVLFWRLIEETSKFGDIEITGKDDVAQWTMDTKTASVTFAPSPYFLKFKKPSPESTPGRNLSAKFSTKFQGRVNWLGAVMFSSKNGALILPPADKGLVWEALEAVSHESLKRVVVVPVPHGAGVSVGVRSETSNFGISSALGKILSVFIGLGPSFSVQDGTTMPTGTWSQQYLVFEEDPNGIPFAIDLVTPQEVRTGDADTTQMRVQLARELAVKQAEALADAMTKVRQR